MVALGCGFALDVFTIAQQDRPLPVPTPLAHDPGLALWLGVLVLVGLQPLTRVDVLLFLCSCFYCHSFLMPQRPLTTHLAVQCLAFPARHLQLLTSLVSAFPSV